MSASRITHRVLRPLGLAAALASAALAPAAAPAQEPADTFALDELVVTATRLLVPRSAVPAAVTVLSGEELRARGIRFLADALESVPGATVVRTGSEGGVASLFLRGGESDYVQVLVDGVAVNDPGGAMDLGQLTLDGVERIEVVRGPVSVLYGSDAVTGVVHVITRRGGARPRVNAALVGGVAARPALDPSACAGGGRCGDAGRYTTRGWEVGASGAARALRWTIGGSGFDGGGAYPLNSGYDNRTASARLDVGGDAGDAALSARFTDGRYRYPTDGAGRVEDANSYRDSESLALGLDAGRALTRSVELRAGLSLHRGDYETVDEPDSPADTLAFYASSAGTRIVRRKADLQVNVRAGRTLATMGVELERQSEASEFTSRSQFGPFDSSAEHDRANRALYAQLVLAPASRVSATAGARRDDNDRFGSFLTWRAGASARVSPATTLRVSAGTAFKEPTFYENYAQGFVRGNPGLEPERSRSWELGLEQRLPRELGMLAATWFDQRYRDLIQYSFEPAPGAPNYVNIGAATSRGLEVEAHLGRDGGATVTASWVHLLTEVVDAGLGADPLFRQDEPLVRRPRERLRALAEAPVAKRVRAGAAVTAVGRRDDLDFLADPSGARVTLPAYAVVELFGDVALHRRPRGEGPADRELVLRVRVDNVLDTEYREVANFPATGRALTLSLRAGAGL